MVEDVKQAEHETATEATQYNPAAHEERIAALWAGEDAFRAEPDRRRKKFSIVIPPPNVTSILHLGHALNNSLQDVLVRYRRMQGFEALWVPGTDHAGIATQNVVEREFAAKEKKSRYDLGREGLVRRIREWKETYGGRILQQLRRIGCSCDWSRTRFTLDEGLSRAVRAFFVRLTEDGLLYRGRRLVNWCPRCCTALADDEVEHRETEGKLYDIRYPLVDEEGAPVSPDAPSAVVLVVSTTRPETMLGDAAVAVHPEDERWARYVGRRVVLPLTGRTIPVVADETVERGFGTGCLKVTPAHDPTDYEIGLRHGLKPLNILTEDGRLNDAVPERFRGLSVKEARRAVLAALREGGFGAGEKKHVHQVGCCYRCKTVVEPFLTPQWFVKMKELSGPAVRAVEDGRLRFHSERWTKVYLRWFDEVRDWCISRQIWWGHRIPAWYCLKCNEKFVQRREVSFGEPYDVEHDGKRRRLLLDEKAKPIVAAEAPERCPDCGGRDLVQDPDVLDTWFSSALWPFSTLGWPDRTADLKYFFPTDVLVTGRDIIYFWVARMVMASERVLGRTPFRDVYINGTVLDDRGRVMSKSLGNGIDPLEVVAAYGADALRFTLVSMTTGGQDLKISMKRFETGRNFANKLWNAARFVLGTIEPEAKAGAGKGGGEQTSTASAAIEAALRDEDRWILSRLNRTVAETGAALDEFDFDRALQTVYSFLWDEFCAWTIELCKPRLLPEADIADAAAARAVLLYVLDRALRLLHPFCPFITETLWEELNKQVPDFAARNLGRDTADSVCGFVPADGTAVEELPPRPGGEKLLARSPWPRVETERFAPELEVRFKAVFDAVRAVRNLRQKNGISPKTVLRVLIRTTDEKTRQRLESGRHILALTAGCEPPEIGPDVVKPKPAGVEALAGAELYVALEGAVDLEKERARLDRELEKKRKYVESIERKLANEKFAAKAPARVVEAERARLAEAKEQMAGLSAAREELGRR